MKLINLQKILGAGVPSLRLSLLAESVAVAFAAYLAALCLVGCLAGTPFAGYVDADMSFAANRPLVGGARWSRWAWGSSPGCIPPST